MVTIYCFEWLFFIHISIAFCFASGDELLQILSQQDMEASSPTAGAFLGNALEEEDTQQGSSDLPEQATAAEAEERTAAASKHLVGTADGMPTDGRDKELQEALAAETEHKVSLPSMSCCAQICTCNFQTPS